jgi:hypothetical protein
MQVLLPAAYCLLPTAFCPLPSVRCLLPAKMDFFKVCVVIIAQFERSVCFLHNHPIFVQVVEWFGAGDDDVEFCNAVVGTFAPGAGLGAAAGQVGHEGAVGFELKRVAVEVGSFVFVLVPEIRHFPVAGKVAVGDGRVVAVVVGTVAAGAQSEQYNEGEQDGMFHNC